jgi:hypothetical protein
MGSVIRTVKTHKKELGEDYCGYFDPNIHNQGAASELWLFGVSVSAPN